MCLQIFEALGTPNEAVWAGVDRLAHYRDNYPQWQPKDWAVLVPRLAGDELGIHLLSSMLAYDPEARISAAHALKHPWFDELGLGPAPNGMPSSSRGVAHSFAAAQGLSAGLSAGVSAGLAAHMAHAAAHQGAPAARPPPMPSMQGHGMRAGGLPAGAIHGQLQHPQHGFQQQYMPVQPDLQLQSPHVQLVQPQVQLQHLHLQQAQLQGQQQHGPMAAAAGPPAAGLQAACRNSTGQTFLFSAQRPAQHPGSGGSAGAAPTPA